MECQKALAFLIKTTIKYLFSLSLSPLTMERASEWRARLDDNVRGMMLRKFEKLFFLVICRVSAEVEMGTGSIGAGKMRSSRDSSGSERPNPLERPINTQIGPRHKETITYKQQI